MTLFGLYLDPDILESTHMDYLYTEEFMKG
jgi:hypothetical protein